MMPKDEGEGAGEGEGEGEGAYKQPCAYEAAAQRRVLQWTAPAARTLATPVPALESPHPLLGLH